MSRDLESSLLYTNSMDDNMLIGLKLLGWSVDAVFGEGITTAIFHNFGKQNVVIKCLMI